MPDPLFPLLADVHPGAALGRLLLQVAVILLATRAAGALFRRAGLPAVVGEIAAGIFLGPSLLGWLWPGVFATVFSAGSLEPLRLLSQIGVTVFMFVVGMDLDAGELRARARSAFVIGQTGIVAPFLLGVGAAFFLYPQYAGRGAPFTPFALFLGIAMSITAFPVLVRILRERGLMPTPLGATAVACAAAGDATAWALLALIVAWVRGAGIAATLYNLGGLLLFVAVMLGPIRRWLRRWRAQPGPAALAGALLFMALAALATELLGIHALFGAFLAGTLLAPHKALRAYLEAKLGGLTAGLLPLFFAFSGLRTQLGLVHGAAAWGTGLAIVLLATVGKLGSTLLAARAEGMAWPEAFALGALMNTRGLMELIALNIGYELGVLPPLIFTLLVLMALATTLLTGPLLDLGERFRNAPGPTRSP
jgi:Kef-type K+ transport system membrane component KefB